MVSKLLLNGVEYDDNNQNDNNNNANIGEVLQGNPSCLARCMRVQQQDTAVCGHAEQIVMVLRCCSGVIS